jgi:hypothetical protein
MVPTTRCRVATCRMFVVRLMSDYDSQSSTNRSFGPLCLKASVCELATQLGACALFLLVFFII